MCLTYSSTSIFIFIHSFIQRCFQSASCHMCQILLFFRFFLQLERYEVARDTILSGLQIDPFRYGSLCVSFLIRSWFLIEYIYIVFKVLEFLSDRMKRSSPIQSSRTGEGYACFDEKLSWKGWAVWWLWLHCLPEIAVWTCYNSLRTYILPIMPFPVHGSWSVSCFTPQKFLLLLLCCLLMLFVEYRQQMSTMSNCHFHDSKNMRCQVKDLHSICHIMDYYALKLLVLKRIM